MALLGALFAGVPVLQDPGWEPVGEWVATLGTLTSAGLVVSMVRSRLDVVVRLTDAARRDPLTGLLNRRGFEDAFEVELERARPKEQSLSVIVGDLDREHGAYILAERVRTAIEEEFAQLDDSSLTVSFGIVT